MNKIRFYTFLAWNLLRTAPSKIKLNLLKKHGTEEEVDEYVYKIVSNWSRATLKGIGVNVLVRGHENLPEGACLFVANHQGNFDFLAMMGFIDKPIGFVAKKELLKYPYFPKWMEAMYCVFIDRDDMRQSVRAINKAAENLRNGHSIVIFPEGTRSRSHKINEFKKGSVKLAEKAKVPIVPVTVDGSYKIFEDYDGKKVMPGEITLIIDKPINLDEVSKEEKKNYMKNLHDIIEKNLNDI